MSDKPGSTGESGLSWKRAAEFLKSILTLERAVRDLQAENQELRRQVDRLKQVVDDHNGQLKVILSLMG
ncbi:hypothetical protein [Jiella sp. M17.18]|uniref:hypothetical protein n=1 Tax=Jiella sp. M17.18 TaxID=3234247 RepID=UPI0034DF176E